MSCRSPRALLWQPVLGIALGITLEILATGAPAHAESGGGGGKGGGPNPNCLWADDRIVELGSKKLLVPHDKLKSQEMEHTIDGYEVIIDKRNFFVTFISPEGLTFQAGLTRIANKRCTAFFIGKPEFKGRVE